MRLDARGWRRHFEDEAERRRLVPDPDWGVGARLAPAVVRSLQKFQVGESGDGANLIRKAGGGDYGVAARLFVAEELNHARMLALLLEAAGAPTIERHWSDVVFVRLRRSLGLRTELAVLLIAEVVALAYYRVLRDGAGDALARDVAARVLCDERRHVPFHRDRIGRVPGVVAWGWRLAVGVVAGVVAVDHGSALRALGGSRWRFAVEVFAEARAVDLEGAGLRRERVVG
ncbi:ferritin-like domain-containing protein [Actinomadura hibisca]|uniref:ferritin-like domain-containing protein n=1 Tax=Actinomadura hibisca TaxID=68565 RepID=UPI0008324974|nr:ferritin-like domain-containing protein [Actinomadura hibisca]